MTSPVITKDTLIPIGAIATVLLAGFSYGLMTQRVANLSEQQTKYEERTEARLSRIEGKLDQLLGIKSVSYVK